MNAGVDIVVVLLAALSKVKLHLSDVSLRLRFRFVVVVMIMMMMRRLIEENTAVFYCSLFSLLFKYVVSSGRQGV